ncbi:MAG TPA: fibrillarin-like rRNA/tRNA 2'-O-methyltransferase [Xanthobacteraceae bacterium]|nr:fibrillarin-like rRNA/tRNA 2'-O-methyltransferase [Xanthobacteraceae bacterium]
MRYLLAILSILIAASWLGPGGVQAQDYAAIVASPDRSDADRNNDKKRKPEQMLAFTGVKAGMKVMDLVSSAGYSAELLARSVGPSGTVYAVNSQETADRVKDRFEPRASKVKSLVPVVRDYADPVPPEVNDLDLVTIYFSYHDLVHMEVDRAAMNKKVFAALKPGGYYVVADHSAKAGDGIAVTKTLHRIEESALRKEIEAAGFKLVAEGSFLRNPEDTRDSNVNRSTTPNDEFVLKFQK